MGGSRRGVGLRGAVVTSRTPRPVSVEVGRWPRTRVVYEVFCAAVQPVGSGWWLLAGGKGWRSNTTPARGARHARFSTFERAEVAALDAPLPPDAS